jgi:hypothetical protein
MQAEPGAAIETKRLHLISLTAPCLQALFTGDYQQAQAAAGFVISQDCVLLNDAWVGRRLRMIEADAEQL